MMNSDSCWRGSEYAIVECAEAYRGMGHSLAAGVAAELDADGWVIALGDMPHIRPDTIRAVAQALERGAELVVPVFAGQRGHPVGFGAGSATDLLSFVRGRRRPRCLDDARLGGASTRG